MATRAPRQPKPTLPPEGATRGDSTAPGQVLTEEVVVGGTPGSVTAKITPLPGKKYTLGAVASREYVSGQQTNSIYNWMRSLPFAIDDITSDFGDDLYDRMQLDDGVNAAILTLKSGILSEPIETITATVDENDDPRAKVATEITACCRRTLRYLQVNAGFDEALWNMCDALPLGNKVAELTFGRGRGEDVNRLVPLLFKPKKRRTVSFAVDVYMNNVGFLAIIPGLAYPVQVGLMIEDPANIPNFLLREKFAVLSWRPKDWDPRGTSVLRPAYTAWNFKMQLWGEYMKFLANYIVPTLIGFLPDQAISAFATDPNGNLTLDSNNNPVLLDAAAEMAAQLAQVRNAGAGAFAFGSKVEVVQAAAAASAAFDNAFMFLNDCIARAILGQTLATGEGRHDSRAAAQVHQDVLLQLIKQAKQSVCSMIERDLFTPIVRYNWGEQYLDLVPSASLGEVSEPDKATLWGALAALVRENAIVPSQWEEIYAELGLPPASAQNLAELERRWMAALIPAGVAVREAGTVGTDSAPTTPAASGQQPAVSTSKANPPHTAPPTSGTPPAQRTTPQPTNGRHPVTAGRN